MPQSASHNKLASKCEWEILSEICLWGSVRWPDWTTTPSQGLACRERWNFTCGCCCANQNWTADRLTRRCLVCNQLCSFCDQQLETANHLTVGWSYAKEICAGFSVDHNSLAQVGAQAMSVRTWWNNIHRCTPKEQRREMIALACYAAWHLWKERGRRVFQGQEMAA
jgi:hypothetical protein